MQATLRRVDDPPPIQPARRSRPGRRWRIAAIVIVIAVGTLIAALASVVPFSSDVARRAVIAALSNYLDGDVELPEFQLRVLPQLHVQGSGLTIRHKGRRDVPPLISIARFSADGGVIGLLRKHVSRMTLEGLDIEIPPDRNRDVDDARTGRNAARDGQPESQPHRTDSVRGFVVDELVSTDARLAIIPSEAGKEPKVWNIHHLRMKGVSIDRPMPFEATLRNAVPPGDIETRGTFGAWQTGEPGKTPLDGSFTFDRADLGVFKGIAGMLSAHGTFGGTLEQIDIHGETDTPSFTVAVGGHPVHLRTTYHATVDGTNGNTILERVDGSFLNTSLVAKGGVIGTPARQGRTVTLDVTMERARLEDILQLVIKAPKPPMTGALTITTRMELPPGDVDVVKKLRLDGQFAIAGTRFTNADVQSKINDLSHRSRGQAPDQQAQRVASQFNGTFKLSGGTITIPQVTFDIPGSTVRLAGRYDLVPETLDFSGTVFMAAKVSETMTGYKRFLLKIADPLFNAKRGGSAIPVKIGGTRSDPSFGLDKGRLFERK